MSKAQKQEKSLQELLCEVIPSLAKMPADLLGSKTKTGAALSAFSSALGKITDLKRFSDRLEKDLRQDLKTEKTLRQIFNDADLINQSLQGEVVKALLVDEEIWKAIERHKSSLLQVLDKKCYQGLDQVLRDIIESPSVITSKTALTLATAISQNPKALDVIGGLFKEISGIMLYLKDSSVIKSQLKLQGIKVENRMLLFATIIPLIQIPLPHLKEIINLVNVVLEQEVKPVAVIDAIEKLVPMLRELQDPAILSLLNFERIKPLIEDLSYHEKLS